MDRCPDCYTKLTTGGCPNANCASKRLCIPAFTSDFPTFEDGVSEERRRIVKELREEADHKESINVVNTAETLLRLADNFEAGYGRTKPEDEE